LESLIDDKTRAILLNNPSNPCGSVYRKEHLQEILKVAERRRIPIIADEIYEDMTFDGYTFHSLASLSTKVPIISVGGLAKRYLIPGWRLGWLVLHDREGAFSAVRRGCHSLATLILGANSLVQSIVPTVLHNTPPEYYVRTMKMLQDQANHFAKRVSQVSGLKPITPQGAMYLMVQVDCSKFKDIKDDVEFSEKLVQEELVVVLPGQIFKSPNFFRVVVSAPVEVLDQACDRIAAFCARHSA
jgi:tyrosine aminotransferase